MIGVICFNYFSYLYRRNNAVLAPETVKMGADKFGVQNYSNSLLSFEFSCYDVFFVRLSTLVVGEKRKCYIGNEDNC